MFNFLCITFLLIFLEHNPHIPEIINWNYSSYRTIFRIRKREINLFSFSLIKKCSNAVDYGEFDFLPNLGCSAIECHLHTGLWDIWFPPKFRLFCYRMPPPYWAMRLPMRKKCQIFKLLKRKAPKTSTKRLSLDVILSFNYHNSWHSLSCSKVWVMFLLYLGWDFLFLSSI